MAQIYLSSLNLVDKWPGTVNPNLGIPTGGWSNTTDNFITESGSTTPAYPIGTKIMAYTDNSYCPGYYTMQYLMFHQFEDQDIDVDDFSEGQAWCAHLMDMTANTEMYDSDQSSTPWYVVTNEITALYSDATRAQRLCMPCFTLTSDGTLAQAQGYGDAYGWFWVGGVCPVADATILDDDTGTGIGHDVSTDGVYCGPVYFDMTPGNAQFTFGEISRLDISTVDGLYNRTPFAYADVSEQ